jgi:hypothetical protein
MAMDKILKHLGLSKEMTSLPSSSNFVRYVTNEYRNSARNETDEVYGMYEINLFHRPSGIRIMLTSREDYFGEVVYKVIRLFITTTAKKELEVLDLDLETKIYHTPEGEIPFAKITFDK